MVRIHHTQAGKKAEDQQALATFQKQWQIYQKLVDSDLLSHREVYGLLHQVLLRHFPAKPFNFLELACGDAGSTVTALMGTTVAHYHGLDLSKDALALARRNLAKLPCAVELEERDFIAAMRDRPEPADVVWIGLSLHHLLAGGKRELMREARAILGKDGMMMIYEPVMLPGETRQENLARVEGINRHLWGKVLTPDELDAIFVHIRGYDYPETVENFEEMARQAGFSRAETLFTNPSGLYTMFCFYA